MVFLGLSSLLFLFLWQGGRRVVGRSIGLGVERSIGLGLGLGLGVFNWHGGGRRVGILVVRSGGDVGLGVVTVGLVVSQQGQSGFAEVVVSIGK